MLAGSGGDEVRTQVPPADELLFAYELMDQECYELAGEMVKSNRGTQVYNDDNTLALARIAVMTDKVNSAAALYSKLEDSTERTLALALSSGDENSAEELKKLISEEIDEFLSEYSEEQTKEYERAAKAAAFADSSYELFLNGETVDTEEVKKECKKIISLSKDKPELLRIPVLRIARLKLQLMSEDYAGIAECVDDYSDYNELLIVSELYMNGYIKAKDFSEDYRKGEQENYQIVADKLKEVYSSCYADKSRSERRAAGEQISALKALMKNTALVKVQNGLLRYAESDFSYDKSKVYLQLAKTENYMGNVTKSNEYVDRSLNTVGDCADEEYTAPMYEIIGIIADKDDPERLKDVAVYTDRILSNTMTVRMSEELHAPAAGTEDEVVEDEPDTEDVQSLDFSTRFKTYVSQKRMAINISGIEASDGVVRANINISGDLDYSVDEIRKLLVVSDCGLDVSDFTIEKIEYKASNILMCCDVSGSMTNQAINDLKQALTTFVNTTDEIESVALITFSGSVEEKCLFGTEDETLLDVISGIRSGGGTDIYNALCESIQCFDNDIDTIKTIILLSDGDAYIPGDDELNANIIAPCEDKGITIYSVGLTHNVNSELLTKFAAITGGSYVYASDSSQISSFFDSLRAQTLNGYRLKFTAPDTIQNTRNLRVSLNGESYTYDEKWYTLDGSPVDESMTEENIVFFENKTIYGFDEKLIFKSERSRTVDFLGSGFAQDDRFTIGLSGCIDYNSLGYEYVNDTTLRVTIPAGIACDCYDVKLTLNGRKTTLKNGLAVVVQGSEKQTVFGDYVFTSYFKEVTSDGVNLSQYVTMNGWLSFKGDVRLAGDFSSGQISLYTSDGAYIHYGDTAGGIAAAYSGKDLVIPLNGEFLLYRTPDDDSRTTGLSQLPLDRLAVLGDVRMLICPDRLRFTAYEISLRMPYLNDVLRSRNLYSYKTDVSGSIAVDFIEINAAYDSLSDRDRPRSDTPAYLGNTPVFINDSYTRFNIDSRGVSLQYVAALPFISDESAFDLSICGSWSGDVRLDDVQLRSAYDVPLKGVPAGVTVGSFKLGLKKNTDKYILVGGFDMNSQTLSELFPGIDTYLGDMADESLVSCDKSELVLALGENYITAKADITMMKHIKLDNVLMELGKSDNDNKLLGLDSNSVYGFRGLTDAVVGIHNDSSSIDVDGAVEAHITDSFIGITADGTVSIDVDWWTAAKTFSGNGTFAIGVQKSHDGELYFVTKAQDANNTFYIRWGGLGGDYYGSTQI
ncbi:MAG: VWA domain-containing protein [Oscillospiraceae bacterium]